VSIRVWRCFRSSGKVGLVWVECVEGGGHKEGALSADGWKSEYDITDQELMKYFALPAVLDSSSTSPYGLFKVTAAVQWLQRGQGGDGGGGGGGGGGGIYCSAGSHFAHCAWHRLTRVVQLGVLHVACMLRRCLSACLMLTLCLLTGRHRCGTLMCASSRSCRLVIGTSRGLGFGVRFQVLI
jgi:hypothetical protein